MARCYEFTVVRTCQAPTDDAEPVSRSLPEVIIFQFVVGTIANSSRRWLSPAGLDLAEKLLTYDPMKRISAPQAMDTSYFMYEEPSASKPVGCVVIVSLFSFN